MGWTAGITYPVAAICRGRGLNHGRF
uniref:Uncharacterized protein n=1 Tax=Arundo donax TaxID=35708 RepID=A0A0A9A3G6_ARUDO